MLSIKLRIHIYRSIIKYVIWIIKFYVYIKKEQEKVFFLIICFIIVKKEINNNSIKNK